MRRCQGSLGLRRDGPGSLQPETAWSDESARIRFAQDSGTRDVGYPGPMTDATLIDDLSEAERKQLEQRHYVRTGEGLVWLERGGAVRRERASSLYYIQTGRGVFRVSRISQEVVEV